jgi:hypothetical protein
MSRKLAGGPLGYPASFSGAAQAPGGEMFQNNVYDAQNIQKIRLV